MRYIFVAMTVLMLLFAVVQYNDPDGPLWMVLYGVAAIWAGIAAMRAHLLAATTPLMLLGATLLAGLVLVVVLWPPANEWWRTEVWWEDEASREGMGLMIATAVVLAVFLQSLRLRLVATGRTGSSTLGRLHQPNVKTGE